MSLTLSQVTLNDRAALSRIITEANFPDPYGQLVWPNSTLASRYAGTYARLPRTLLSPNALFVKAVDTSGEAVAYAQWTLPAGVWEREMEGSELLDVSSEERERYGREAEASCESPGWPRGLRREVVEALGPGMREAGERAFPQGEEYIMLDQVKVLPSHQRQGAGSLLVRWGSELADREGLKTCLEATPFGLGLYEKFGFEMRAVVQHDLARFGMPEGYTHTIMVREPKHEKPVV